MTMRRLAMVGGGNMGAALLGGMLAARWAEPDELAVVEVLAPGDELAARFPGVLVTDTMPAAEAAVIAVKPYDVAGATAAAVAAGARRVLSIAAGVATASIEAAAGDDAVAVVRAMPNTPALVGAGAAAIAVEWPPPTTTSRGPRASWAPSAPSSACPSTTSTPSRASPARARRICSSSPRR